MTTMTVAKRATKPEILINDEQREFTDADWPVGSVAHQGDLILVRIKSLPKSKTPRINRQLAEGSTQGSRHVLEGGVLFDVDKSALLSAIKSVCTQADLQERYIGPAFQTKDQTILTHPEHGDHSYEEGMVVAVVYQRSLDAELREQRTRD